MNVFTSSLLLLALAIASGTANAQAGAIAVSNTTAAVAGDSENGSIRGRIITTDHQPAAFVTIHIKELNKYAVTDAQGSFLIRNVKAGQYTLLVTMTGLRPLEKAVLVTALETATVEVSLAEDHKQLDEIVVTAQKGLNTAPVSIGKIAIDPMDLPQSIAVVGQGVLRDQQAQRLSDVIRNVNGVYITTTRGNAQESFGARGYNFSNTNLFKNGARVNVGIMPEMSALEKVEVLKGSAAILYGQVAPGGIVNMVTKQPKFNFGGEVSFRAGSYDLYKPAFDIYGPATGAIAYRLNGTFESANSYRDGVSSKRYYVNPSLLFLLGKRTELVLEGDFLKHDYTPDFGIGSIANTKIADVPRSRTFITPWAYNKVQQTTTTATVKHQFNSSWGLNSSLSYQGYDRNYFSTERIQADSAGDWVRPLGKIDLEETYFVGQVNLNGKFKTGSFEHTLLAGADADRTFTTNKDNTFAQVPALKTNNGYDRINILNPSKYTARTDMPATTPSWKREALVNRMGAYVQDLIKLSPKFNILAGIRWSYVEIEGIDSVHQVSALQKTGKTETEKAFSPRLGLVYKPTATTSVFASYSNSFNVNTGTDIYGTPIDPSLIDQFEVGVKNDFLNGKLSANVTAYRIVNSNLTQTAPLDINDRPNSNNSIKLVSGTSTSDGVEVDLASQPFAGLSVTGGYSYNYMRITKSSGKKNGTREGERLVNNPAHTANASVFYTVQGTRLKGVKLGATASYIGDRVGGWNNVIDPPANQNYDRRIFVDGFTTIDLTAGYTYKKVSLLAKVSNITNTFNYYVHENYSINPIPPAQFTGTISYKF